MWVGIRAPAMSDPVLKDTEANRCESDCISPLYRSSL